MPVRVGGALGRTLAGAMQRAQGGDALTVVGELKGVLNGLGGEVSHERAATEYVLAVAHLMAGNLEQALRAADACVGIGESLHERGWAANALSLRAVALERLGRAAESIDDLVRCEYETRRSTDPGLVAWAHAGLGTAYEELRLFELAAPHYQRTSALRADPLEFPDSQLIDELSLASVHAIWAREIAMLASTRTSHERDVVRLRRTAVEHARRAIGLRSPSSFPHLVLQARLLLAANDWDAEPAARLAELRELRREFGAAEDDANTVECTATLAEVLAASGDVEAAAAEARRAVDVLTPDADTSLDRYVRWVALTVQDAEGDGWASSGLAFGATVARGWWAQRENRLEMMRAAIVGYARYQMSEGDRRAAREDPLTGLGNRRAFDEWLASDEAHSVPSTLLLFDVDRLKRVNDTWGHEAGDDLLSVFAGLLVENTREVDLTLRLGGDEFVIVLRDSAREDGTLVADRISLALDALTHDQDRPHLALMSASLGIASTHEGLDVDRLLSTADTRMYEVKHRRRRRSDDLAAG
ncbi:diguanylate cyclase domain-containing protein [Solicola sp. PLA-1-18]|uniref:GGDEF domain-containing protein n=1 Tax=Solicola sp. PLA-1-18 TaxID=3380532 RepID=UPI003B7F439A